MTATSITLTNGHTYLIACATAFASASAGIQTASISGTALTIDSLSPFDTIDLGAGTDISGNPRVLIMTPDGIFSVADYNPTTLTRTALYNLANGKQDPITIDAVISNTSTNPVQNVVIYNALAGKQDTLVSGTSIKTVNGTTLLGSGNVVVGPAITTYGA